MSVVHVSQSKKKSENEMCLAKF